MDLYDNNNLCESVQLELITVKAELKEEPIEDAEASNEEIHLSQTNVHASIDNSSDSSGSGQKRRLFDESSFNIQEDERLSETSSATKSAVKRRKYSFVQNEDSVPNVNSVLSEIANQEERQSKRRQIFTLLVTNSACEWTSQEVIDYIKEQCGIHVSKINDSREANSDSDFQIKLKFSNKDQLNRAYLKLKEKEVEGKLTAQIDDTNDQSEVESDTMAQVDDSETAEIETTEPIQEIESQDNPYELKEEFLESLGISLPITNWVTVTNFRCDRNELKEVLELCGKVLICVSMMKGPTKQAYVMYSHPLEAVQAISMLNGQKYYGKPLKITMSNTISINTILPKGLQGIGPGLGKIGQQLPDLTDQYKTFLEGKKSDIDAQLFQANLLDKLGISVEEISYTRPVNSNLRNEDNASELSRDSPPSTQHFQGNQIGPISQRPTRPNSTPLNRPQFHNNPITNFNNQSVLQVNNPMPSSNIPGPMQGPQGPNPNVIFSSPPIPGVEMNDPRGFHNVPVRPGPISGPMGPMGGNSPIGLRPSAPMIGPSLRIQMQSSTNRFACPMSPIVRSRPVGPSTIGSRSHTPQIRPTVNVGPAIQIGPRNGPGPNGTMPNQNAVPVNIPISNQNINPSLPMSNQSMPRANQNMPMTNQNLPMANQNMPMANQNMPMANQNMPMANQNMPMANQNMPLPNQSRPMQNQSMPMQMNQNQISNVQPGVPTPFIQNPSGPNVQMFKGHDPVTLQISNLPPTTNFVNLGQKLSELGHVIFLEFTTPGCAVVRFATPSDAERCFQNYRKVLG